MSQEAINEFSSRVVSRLCRRSGEHDGNSCYSRFTAWKRKAIGMTLLNQPEGVGDELCAPHCSHQVTYSSHRFPHIFSVLAKLAGGRDLRVLRWWPALPPSIRDFPLGFPCCQLAQHFPLYLFQVDVDTRGLKRLSPLVAEHKLWCWLEAYTAWGSQTAPPVTLGLRSDSYYNKPQPSSAQLPISRLSSAITWHTVGGGDFRPIR